MILHGQDVMHLFLFLPIFPPPPHAGFDLIARNPFLSPNDFDHLSERLLSFVGVFISQSNVYSKQMNFAENCRLMKREETICTAGFVLSSVVFSFFSIKKKNQTQTLILC